MRPRGPMVAFSCSDGCCPGTGHASNDAWGVKAAFDLVTAGLGLRRQSGRLGPTAGADPGLMMAADEIPPRSLTPSSITPRFRAG